MAIPSVPTNFLAQPGNGAVYLQWYPAAGATSYNILRSTNDIDFSSIGTLASSSFTSFYDTTAVLGHQYFYSINSQNTDGASNNADSQVVTTVNQGRVSLGQVRLYAQQRADMVNNEFVTTQEWNTYINHSYNELYDLMVQVYGDEYFVSTTAFLTDGRIPAKYPLPPNIYKLMGMDYGNSPQANAWITLTKFPFAKRNAFFYQTMTGTIAAPWVKPQYRIVGNDILIIPNPQANQSIQLWYVPRPLTLLADSDILDAISGWDEVIVVDAAIKALAKEESDVTVLMAQKDRLIKRIEAAASNRDAGMPETVTDIRRMNGFAGGLGGWSDDSWGGS